MNPSPSPLVEINIKKRQFTLSYMTTEAIASPCTLNKRILVLNRVLFYLVTKLTGSIFLTQRVTM